MIELDRTAEKKRISTICLGLVLLLAVSLLASLFFSAAAGFLLPEIADDWTADWWLSAAAQYLVAFPLGAVFISQVPPDPMESSRWRAGKLIRCFLIACMLMFFGNLAGNLADLFLAGLLGRASSAYAAERVMGPSLFYSLVMSVFAAPFWEELVFRKLMIDRLNRLGDRAAIWISSLVFALFHANLQQFFYALAAGWFFGYIYTRTARLRYTVLLHMSLNFVFGFLPVLAGYWAVQLPEALILGGEILLAVAGLVCLSKDVFQVKLLRGWIRLPEGRWGSLAFCNPGMILLLAGCAAMFLMNLWL